MAGNKTSIKTVQGFIDVEEVILEEMRGTMRLYQKAIADLEDEIARDKLRLQELAEGDANG